MVNCIWAQGDVLKVDSQIVRVPLVVMDRDGRYISGIDKKLIHLSENGEEQDIVSFETVDAPFSLMIVADISGSMASHMVELGKAIDTLISKLRPEDSITLATFSNWDLRYRISNVKKRDFKYQPDDGHKPKQTGPFTTTFDAVEDAISYLSKVPGRKAIIIFGDGEPYGARATAKSNLKAAEEQESIIYTIRYGEFPPACVLPRGVQDFKVDSDPRQPNDIITGRDLAKNSGCPVRELDKPDLIKRVDAHFRGLADVTGGRSYRIKDISDLGDTFTQIVAELGQSYTIAYEPKIAPKEGERRRITVKADIPNVAIRSRNQVVFGRTKK